MDYYTVRYIDYQGEDQVGEFADHSAAWRFMRECDEIGVPVGYPVRVEGKV